MKTPVLLLAVLAVGVLDARSRWVRLMSSHFEVLTDAGERAGREVLARFEQIRQAYGPGRASPLPVRVYVFSRESDFAPFRPAKSTEGFYQSSAERDFIAMHLAGAESYRVVFHEYVHLVLNHSSSRMPIWFEEGLAEFYSTLKFESNRLRVGGVIPVHVATLANQKWLTASQLAALTKSSPYYNEEGRTAVFYAQSWALVHMLHTSRAWRDGLERYVDLLAETVEPDRAFRQAFGRTLAGALADLEDVIRTRRFPVAEGPWEPREVAPPIIEAVAETDAEMARAELFHATGKSKNALEIYTKLAARAGESVQLETALGRLALAARRYGEARDHLEKAIRLGSTTASTFFEYAMLLRESGGDRDEVVRLLRRTVDLNPQYAEAHFLLGARASSDKRFEEAVEHLQRAAKILPRQSYFWHALALAYHELNRPELARRAAQRALDNAANAQETQMASDALRLVEAKAAAAGTKKPPVTLPESWLPRKGDARVEGGLVLVECGERALKFHIVASSARLVLFTDQPGKVELHNSPAVNRQFPCGPQKNLPVSVEYVSATLELVAIEFR